MTLTAMRLVSLLIVVLCLPAASAAVDLAGQLSFDPKVRQVLFEQGLTGPDATALRHSVDRDDDGHVTASEQQAWESVRAEPAGGCTDQRFNFTTIDGNPTSWARPYTYATLRNVQGPVTDTSRVGVTLVMSIESDEQVGAGDIVSIRFSEIRDIDRLWDCNFGVPNPLDLSLRPSYLFIEIEGVLLEPLSLQTALVDGDGEGLQLDDPEEIEVAYTNEIRFLYVPKGGLLAGLGDELRMAGLALGTIGILFIGANVFSSVARERCLRALALILVPLFSRIRREKALDHERRERLYAYIRDHQGVTFADLRRELDIGSGSLSHHLNVLTGQGFLQAYRDGLRDRFYLKGPKAAPDDYLTRTQRAILEVIAANPGIQQGDLAKRVGLTRQSVQYHGKTLSARGVVKAERAGRTLSYSAIEGADGPRGPVTGRTA